MASLACVRHTGHVRPTTSAEQSAHTHRCPHGTSASNLPNCSVLRQMQHSFCAASASTNPTDAAPPPSSCPSLPLSFFLMLRCFRHVCPRQSSADLNAGAGHLGRSPATTHPRLQNAPQRQYLCFGTRKASKVRTCGRASTVARISHVSTQCCQWRSWQGSV